MQRVGSAPAKLMMAPFKKFRKEILEALKKTEGARGKTTSLYKSRIPGELKPTTRVWLKSKAANVPHKKGTSVIIQNKNIFTHRGTNQDGYKSSQTFSNVNHASVRRLRRTLTGKSEKTNISPRTMKALQRRFHMMK